MEVEKGADEEVKVMVILERSRSVFSLTKHDTIQCLFRTIQTCARSTAHKHTTTTRRTTHTHELAL